MKTGLRVFAYVLIWTTPLQLLLVIWGGFIVLTTDYGVLSLTHKAFFVDYVPVLWWLLIGYMVGCGGHTLILFSDYH